MSTRKLSWCDLWKLLFVVIVVAALTACGSNTTPEATEAPQTAEATVAPEATTAPASEGPIELVHWSWLSASDAVVWEELINEFNATHTDIQIRMETFPDSEWDTKVLAAVDAGQGPDFGWVYPAGGLHAEWIDKGIIIPLDDLAAQVGLDLNDFIEPILNNGRYPAFGNQLYEIPLDVMTMAFEINKDHALEAGLDINNPPQTGEELIQWAEAMTVREGDTVVRSGLLMGPAIQNTVTWGVVSAQMGFRRASEDLKTACINPEAGKAAMQWILDAYNKYNVSTLEVTDRYKAFGAGQGSMFMTGPWTVSGYVDQGLNFMTIHVPKIGEEQTTYLEVGSLEVYKQQDESRYAATMEAIKWLSDNSITWTTVGRGASPRKSILASNEYQTTGLPWEQRGAFVDEQAMAMATTPIGLGITENPSDFVIYAGSNFLAETLDGVWYGQLTIDEAMDQLCEQWQKDLDASKGASAPAVAPTEEPAAREPIELVHWSWLSASDAVVWEELINEFNATHTDIQIRMETFPDSEWDTKVLAAVDAGQGPDFGWVYPAGGLHAEWIDKGIIIPLDDLATQVGLDLNDFIEPILNNGRYPAFGNQLYEIPLDVMTMAFEINKDHALEAGLDINNPPQTGEELIQWAEAMTVREGDTVVRSGLLMGPAIQNTVTWGVISAQMGFRRASEDLKTACINPEAGKAAMQWILDAYDKYNVSTLEVTDRYKAFGAGQGSMFMTGPWTVSGYVDQGLNFMTIHVPKIGEEQTTYLEVGSLEVYKQEDESRYAATMEAIKWLSDNSITWTTVGRGASPRKSILASNEYQTTGLPWEQRGAFVDEQAMAMATTPIGLGITENPIDFVIYAGSNFLAETLDGVWYGQLTIDEAMDQLCEQWQKDLDASK